MAKFNLKNFSKDANIEPYSPSKSPTMLINGLLNSASQNMAATYKDVKMLDITKLIPNDKNFYSIDEAEVISLAETIAVAGLQQPIVVLSNGDEMYKIITGHKRARAFEYLARDNQKYQYIPAFVLESGEYGVDLPITDENKEEYLLIITNSEMRNKTENDKYSEFLTLRKIYTEARNNGYKLPAKMREVIATDMNLSTTTVGRIEYIDRHADESVKNALADGLISIRVADEIAHDTKETQKETVENMRRVEEDVVTDAGPDQDNAKTNQAVKKEIREKVLKPLENEMCNIDIAKLDELSVKLNSIIEDYSEINELTKKNCDRYDSLIAKIDNMLDSLGSIVN